MGPGRLSFPPDVNELALQQVIDFLAEGDERYKGKKSSEYVDGSVLAGLKAKGACGGSN